MMDNMPSKDLLHLWGCAQLNDNPPCQVLGSLSAWCSGTRECLRLFQGAELSRTLGKSLIPDCWRGCPGDFDKTLHSAKTESFEVKFVKLLRGVYLHLFVGKFHMCWVFSLKHPLGLVRYFSDVEMQTKDNPIPYRIHINGIFTYRFG